ncbi:WecB/TagA/CpsF family glycosyltransferase [Thermosinus carboxydivorans]|uniref:WecB/TagA/CpsF family glycosyltransferase n=1 Tax=Thermosinus carboxydivorans TaxID=261685 RepID=UPI0002DD60F4|nr:WecB/TagA/CpsF family glycosyltransferase [Thermosinus carboxydivorans]
MRTRINILNVPIDVVTMKEALTVIEGFIADKSSSHLVATANAEMVMMAQSDKELANILRQADLVVPDGAGIVWAARYHGYKMPERVAGFDLAQAILARAATTGYRIFLLGGAPGIAARAKAVAESRYPGVNIVGTYHGFFQAADEAALLADIRARRPDVIFVALGVPKQEKWLWQHRKELSVPVAIGVGGTFDVMAGTVRRAPVWMQRAGLEWLYRLMSQPQRAVRMLALPRFVYRVLTDKKLDKDDGSIL